MAGLFVAMMVLQVLAQEQAVPDAAPTVPTGPRFSIYEYVVDGNSLMAESDIEKSVAPFMGEDKSIKDVDGARAALEKAYHDAGYLTVLVTIPEQNVDSGAVALHVVEAGVDKVVVKGAEYTLPSEIKARVPELTADKAPNFNLMQEQLASLNRSGDLKVTPILRAGQMPGTVEVQLDVEDQLAVHGNLEINNRRTPNTTSERVVAGLRYDNLFQRGASLGLTAQMAPERTSDVRVLAGNYTVPVGNKGDTLSMFAVHSRSQFASLSSAPGLGLLGNTDTLGSRYSLLLTGTSSYVHTLSVGADYKNVQQTTYASGIGTDSPIVYLPMVATYNGNLMGNGRTTALDVTFTHGLRGFFMNNDAAFNAKRAGAQSNFMTLRTALTHTETLGRWELYGKVDTQLTSGVLVPTEQLIMGGADTVRGYLEGERAADQGMRGTLEIHTPKFAWSAGGDWRLMALVFFDDARLMVRNPIAPQPAQLDLRSTGFGLRLTAPRGLSLDLDAAHTLLPGDTTPKGDNRLLARSGWNF